MNPWIQQKSSEGTECEIHTEKVQFEHFKVKNTGSGPFQPDSQGQSLFLADRAATQYDRLLA